LELEIDLSSGSPIRAPALRLRLAVGPPAPLAATTVEDHLDIPVLSEPLQEIFVEAGFVARDEEQVASHEPVYCPSALHAAGHFFLTKWWGEHLECHS
jgi:hypothetical protein